MRKLIFFFIIAFGAKSTLSQTTHSISIGPDLGLGANFGKSSKASIGGSLEYVTRFNDKIGIRLAGGYNKFKGSYYDDYVSFLPVRIGVHAFLSQDVIFSFAEAGIANYKASTGTKKTGPSFGIGAGYRQAIADNQFIQFSAIFNLYRYKGNSPAGSFNYTWFNFRVAYGFSFGKKNKGKEE